MKKTLLALVAIITCSLSGAASAYQVVHKESGVSNEVSIWWGGLPGPGTYQFHATSSLPGWFEVMAAYEYHADTFFAPAPRPHDENIEGHDSPYRTGTTLDGQGMYWTFVVPETEYYFFDSDADYEWFGIPTGTPLYREVKFEDPYFSLFGASQNGKPFWYSFTVLKMTAVPEPATWAMMIVGFGAVGSMVRSSRRRNPASPATSSGGWI